jgi:hypothetical protein
MDSQKARMKVGVNYPWMNYGWDFGVGPWGMRRAWEPTLVDELRALKELGVHAVRWFVLGDGLTYGTGAGAPAKDRERLWHGHPQWRFIPPDAEGTRPIIEDFRALLACFRAANDGGGAPIQLMPVVADFPLFFPGNAEVGPFAKPERRGEASPPAGFVKNGRCDLAIDPRKTALYVEHLLRPLVAAAYEPAYRPLIHSFDVINEPEWCTDEGRSEPMRTVPHAAMMAFLRACVDEVRGRFVPTVGFASVETLRKWDVRSLGLGLWQYHYYAKPDVIRAASDFEVRTVLGEFATKTGAPAEATKRALSGLWRQPGDITWPELGGAWGDQRVAARLGLLAEKGYSECFAWSIHAVDKATRWDDEVRGDLQRFAAGEPTP